MKKYILVTTAASFILTGFSCAGKASDIALKHAKASASELEIYLRATPGAEDKAEAVDFLLAAYQLTENIGRRTELMQEKFDSLPSGGKVSAGELYKTTSQLFDILVRSGNKDAARKLIATATEKARGNQMANKLAQGFKQLAGSLNQPSVGDVMDIRGTSIQGKKVDLSKMKGKVILVDFWATWCGPCIAELPNVQKAYAQYHDKGFEIIAISLDSDKNKLNSFISDKKIPWPQLFDGKGWANEIAVQYGIKSIPATFLIGSDGKVVATNLRGLALAKAIGKHLKK